MRLLFSFLCLAFFLFASCDMLQQEEPVPESNSTDGNETAAARPLPPELPEPKLTSQARTRTQTQTQARPQTRAEQTSGSRLQQRTFGSGEKLDERFPLGLSSQIGQGHAGSDLQSLFVKRPTHGIRSRSRWKGSGRRSFEGKKPHGFALGRFENDCIDRHRPDRFQAGRGLPFRITQGPKSSLLGKHEKQNGRPKKFAQTASNRPQSNEANCKGNKGLERQFALYGFAYSRRLRPRKVLHLWRLPKKKIGANRLSQITCISDNHEHPCQKKES